MNDINVIEMALAQCALLWLLHILAFLFMVGKKVPDALIILNFLVLLPIFGGKLLIEITHEPTYAYPFFLLLVIFFFLISPVVGILLWKSYGDYLCRPFFTRQWNDPSLPFSLKLLLAFFGLTVFLPLGGLAIPCWFWIRLHIWPRYESLSHSRNNR